MLVMFPVVAMAAMVTASNPAVTQLVVQDAHVEAGVAGESVGVSMILANRTNSSVVINGATTPVAGETTLQKYVKDANGLIQIAPVNVLTLPPQSEMVIAPGALELQFIGLTQDLQAGLEVPLTLKFSDGSKRVVRIKVDGD